RTNADPGDQQEGADRVAVFAETVPEVVTELFEFGEGAGHGQTPVEIEPQAGFADVVAGEPGLDGIDGPPGCGVVGVAQRGVAILVAAGASGGGGGSPGIALA